jgi:hypothetical protein
VAHLAGEIEHELHAVDGVARRGRGEVRGDPPDELAAGRVEVPRVRAVTRVARVDDGDVGAGTRERQREVGPDEAQSPGHQATTTRDRASGSERGISGGLE